MSQYNNILQNVVSLASEQSTFIEILKATFDLGIQIKPNATQFSSDVDAVSQAMSIMDEFPAQSDVATKLGFSLPSTISPKDASAFNAHTHGYVFRAQPQISADNAAFAQEFDFRKIDTYTSHVGKGAHFSPLLSDTLILDAYSESTSKPVIEPQPVSAQISYAAETHFATVEVLETAKLEAKTAVLRHAKPAAYFVVDHNYHQINQAEGVEDKSDAEVLGTKSSMVSQAEIDTLTKVLLEINEQEDTTTQGNTDTTASEAPVTQDMFTGLMPNFKQINGTLAQTWLTDSDKFDSNESSATEETQEELFSGSCNVAASASNIEKDASDFKYTDEPVDSEDAVQSQSGFQPIDPSLLPPSVNVGEVDLSQLPSLSDLPSPPELNMNTEQSQLTIDSTVEPVDVAVDKQDVIAKPVKEKSADTEEVPDNIGTEAKDVDAVVVKDEPVKGQGEDKSVTLEPLGASELPLPINGDLLPPPLNLSDLDASSLPPMPDAKDLPPRPVIEQGQTINSPVDLSQIVNDDMPSFGNGQEVPPPPPENGFNLSSVKAADMPISSSAAPQTGGLLDGIMGMLKGGLKKAEPIAETDVVQDSGDTGLIGMLSTAIARFTNTDMAQSGAEDQDVFSACGDSDCSDDSGWSDDTDWSEEDVSTIKPSEYRDAAKEFCAKEKSQIEDVAKHIQDHIDSTQIQGALDALGEKFATIFSKQVEAVDETTEFNQQAGEVLSKVQEVLESKLSEVLPKAAIEVVEEQIYQGLQKAVSSSNGTLSLSDAVESYKVDYDAVNQDVGVVANQALKAITDFAHGEFSYQQLTANHAGEVFEAVRTRFNFGKDMMLSKYPQLPEAGEDLKTDSHEMPDLSDVLGKRRGAIVGKVDADDSVDLDALDSSDMPVDNYDSTSVVNGQVDLLSEFNPHDMPVDHFG